MMELSTGKIRTEETKLKRKRMWDKNKLLHQDELAVEIT